MAPLVSVLEFLDTHWKSVLIIVSPLGAPFFKDLIPRLRKVWGVEFDPVALEPVGGVQLKPSQRRTSQAE
jgi:hypothetical protein